MEEERRVGEREASKRMGRECSKAGQGEKRRAEERKGSGGKFISEGEERASNSKREPQTPYEELQVVRSCNPSSTVHCTSPYGPRSRSVALAPIDDAAFHWSLDYGPFQLQRSPCSVVQALWSTWSVRSDHVPRSTKPISSAHIPRKRSMCCEMSWRSDGPCSAVCSKYSCNEVPRSMFSHSTAQPKSTIRSAHDKIIMFLECPASPA